MSCGVNCNVACKTTQCFHTTHDYNPVNVSFKFVIGFNYSAAGFGALKLQPSYKYLYGNKPITVLTYLWYD